MYKRGYIEPLSKIFTKCTHIKHKNRTNITEFPVTFPVIYDVPAREIILMIKS